MPPDDTTPGSSGSTAEGDTRWARVKRVFDHARELPQEDRAAFLNRACGEDPLFREEVEELLDDLDDAGSFLNEPAVLPSPEPTFHSGDVLLNRFRILEFIGHGGMGQVYRAEDMYSGGEMAIKTIRPEIAADVEVTRRFRRELRLSRQVTHPNVCRVFEIWASKQEDGRETVFLTMELLRGETLAQRLAKRGKLSPEEALAIARQVAAGIAEIHRLSIVHRDVKPSNVYLVKEANGTERAVVMDFGLARATQPDASHHVTRMGALLGTPAYMAPELFKGADASIASDIYGFGVTLYEMVTGRNQPVITPRKLVPGLKGWESAIIQCLDPDPLKRPLEIQKVIEDIEKAPRREWWKWAAIATACVLAAIIVIAILTRASNPPATFTPLTMDRGFTEDFSFTADGKTFVYASDKEGPGNLNIWIQDYATGRAHKLAPSPWHDLEPSISPDGQLVAFRSERDGSGLYLVPASGGNPQLVAKYGHHPRFSADGKFLAYWTGQTGDYSEPSARIFVVPVAGGPPRRIAAQFADARYPAWSPEGHRILFRGAPTGFPRVDDDGDWYVVNTDTGEISRTYAFQRLAPLHLDPHDAPAFWDRDRIVFSARSKFATNIWQIRFGMLSSRLDGEPTRLTTESSLEVAPWVLGGGKVAYASWRGSVGIWRVSTRDGNREQITNDEALDSRPTVSSDDTWLVFGRRMAAVRQNYLKNILTGKEEVLESASRSSAAISPDGRVTAFTEYGPKGSRIWLKENLGGEQLLCEDCGDVLSWLPDNSGLLYRRRSRTAGTQIRMLDLQSRQSTVVLKGDQFDQAAISPNQQWIAYTTRKDGVTTTLYVAPFSRGSESPLNARVPLTNGATWDDKPQWAADGSEIFFSSNRDGFMCLWRQRMDQQGHPAGEPRPLYHMHTAGFSPMQLSNVPSYNLSASSHFVYFNSCTVSGNLWMLEP
jgi:Tol biopolymer transport system component